jgi:hypothetical protein
MEMLLSLPWWVLLIASVIPYDIKRQRTQHLQSLMLSALAWRFEWQWRKASCSWSFSLPWVEQLQHSQQVHKAFRSAWIQAVLTWVKKAITLRR